MRQPTDAPAVLAHYKEHAATPRENTMRIKINIDRAEYVRAGLDPDHAWSLDLDPADLTEEERDELAQLINHDGSLYAGGTQVYGSTHPSCLPTLEALRAMLRAGAAKRAELTARQEADWLHQEAAGRAQALADLALPLEAWLRLDCACPAVRWPSEPSTMIAGAAYRNAPGMAERYAEAGAEVSRRMKERDRRMTEEKAWQEAEKETAIARLRAWAVAQGSELLRARIQEGFAWIGLAQEEYVAAHIPDGYGAMIESADAEDRTHPTLAEIEALREARTLVAAHPELSNPRLLYLTIEPEEESDEDEDGEDMPQHLTVLRLVITCPNGHEAEVDRQL